MTRPSRNLLEIHPVGPADTSGQIPPTPQVAVVGCGRWGKNLVRNFHHLGALHAVCDLDPSILTRMRQTIPNLDDVHITNDFRSILEDPQIHALVLATPSHTHYPLAKQAMYAGKHVYVEKPVATRCEDAQELYTMSQERGLVLMTGHLLLYHPAVRRLRQLIEHGVLGEIRYIQSDRLNFNPFRPDKSVIWDLMPHDLSMMNDVLGLEPTGILSAHGYKTGHDDLIDIAHVDLQFPNGIRGHIHNSWVHPEKHVKLLVRGTRATALLDDTLSDSKIKIFSLNGEKDNRPEETFPEYLAIEPLKLECQHFLNCIRFRQEPRTDGLNGYTVVKVLELIHQQLS